MSERAAGRKLRQKVEGIAKELQGAQMRQAAQINDRSGQPVSLQRQLSQLGAALDFPCMESSPIDASWQANLQQLYLTSKAVSGPH